MFISLGYMSRSRIAGSSGNYLTLQGKSKPFSKIAATFYIPPAVDDESSNFSTSLSLGSIIAVLVEKCLFKFLAYVLMEVFFFWLLSCEGSSYILGTRPLSGT